MNLSQTISAVLLGSVYAVAGVPTAVISAPDVKTLAQEITVRIDGRSSNGSGVIVERQGNTYYILTNAHVVNQADTYTVGTPDGNRYRVNYRDIIGLPGVDLAILPFTSTLSYRVAILGKSEQITAGQKVYVSGWPRSGRMPRQRVFITTEGLLTDPNSRLQLGYSLSYTNLVRVGMSGGPVLDDQGRLVGINGLVRLENNSDTIVSSGVGIDRFLNWRSRQTLSAPIEATQTIAPNPAPSENPSASVAKDGTANFALADTLTTGKGSVNAVAISAAKQQAIAASGSSEGTLSIWNLQNGQLINSWRGHKSAVNAVAIAPDGQTLASGSDDNTIKIWDLNGGQLIRTLKGHSGAVTTLAFSPDGQTLVSGSWDYAIKIWKVTTGELRHTLTGHSGLVNSVAISPDGKTLASGSQDTTIRLWNLNTGQSIRTLSGHSLSVLCVVISPDGKTLASGSGEGTIGVWNLSTGQLANTLRGHSDGVWSLTMAREGRTLISGSWDRTIKVWDLSTARLKNTLNGHSDYVVSVALSPDGQTLVSGGWNSQILIWRKSGSGRI